MRIPHLSKCGCLDNLNLGYFIVGTLADKSTLLDTTKPCGIRFSFSITFTKCVQLQFSGTLLGWSAIQQLKNFQPTHEPALAFACNPEHLVSYY